MCCPFQSDYAFLEYHTPFMDESHLYTPRILGSIQYSMQGQCIVKVLPFLCVLCCFVFFIFSRLSAPYTICHAADG